MGKVRMEEMEQMEKMEATKVLKEFWRERRSCW